MTPLFIHHTAGWLDPITVALVAGGLVGAFFRAAFGQQKTVSRRTGFDLLMGGAVAGLLPQVCKWLGVELTGPVLFWFCAGIFVGGYGNLLVVAVLWRAGVFKAGTDPRADQVNGGTPP
jgi:hypothetical protein